MDQENLILSLIERGWYSCDSFIDPILCKKLLEEAQSLPLLAARVGKGSSEQIATGIRNDSLFWLDEGSKSQAQKEYLEEMDNLMILFNRELFLGLRQFEGHFARYDKEGFYKKHLDQFKGNNERLVSVVTYLNSPLSGGELRIYSRDNTEEIEIDIKPQSGRIVCFLSNQIYHEVRPAESERYSIAGWLRTTSK